jgi:hypothetical protein
MPRSGEPHGRRPALGRHRSWPRAPDCGNPDFVADDTTSWYVPSALGERPTSAPRFPVLRLTVLIASVAAAGTLVACGSAEPQDANEPEGEYPVEVTTSKFPTQQRLAETSELVLGVENTGEETIPELAFTIFLDEGQADGSFKIRSEQPGLADPNRSVWILENKYPRVVDEPPAKGLSGGLRAQTNTFGFGPLEPGDTRDIVWRVTPVQPGTYTLHYEVAAGLDGLAKAVTESGGEVKGEFVVTISDKPPKTRVNDAGQVVPAD